MRCIASGLLLAEYILPLARRQSEEAIQSTPRGPNEQQLEECEYLLTALHGRSIKALFQFYAGSAPPPSRVGSTRAWASVSRANSTLSLAETQTLSREVPPSRLWWQLVDWLTAGAASA